MARCSQSAKILQDRSDFQWFLLPICKKIADWEHSERTEAGDFSTALDMTGRGVDITGEEIPGQDGNDVEGDGE